MMKLLQPLGGFLVVLVGLVSGCAGTPGSFTPDGFHQAEHPFAVHYSKPELHQFIDENWRVDNFVVEDDGKVGHAKTTADYRAKEFFDVFGDGKLDAETNFLFDLKLENKKNGSVIWIQHIPLGRSRAERTLSSLVEDYAGALSGSGFYAPAEDEGKVVLGKTFAAKTSEITETTAGGLQAIDARIELANVDQLRLDPSARTALIRIVLVRTPYVHSWGSRFVEPSPVLVRVGYRANPSDFEAGLPDFEKFVKLVEFGAAPPAPARSK